MIEKTFQQQQEATSLLSQSRSYYFKKNGKPQQQPASNKSANNTKNKNAPSVRLDSAPSSYGGTSSWRLYRWLGMNPHPSGLWFPGPFDVRDVEISGLKAKYFAKTTAAATAATTTTTTSGNSLLKTTRVREYRSFQRRFFLFLTEPDTSICSALFFMALITAIIVMNSLMILQTMQFWQYTPTDCLFCGGPVAYSFADEPQHEEGDDETWIETTFGTTTTTMTSTEQQQAASAISSSPPPIPCVCPPTPYAWTNVTLRYLIYFFSVEWILRVLFYSPAPHERSATALGRLRQWINYLFGWQQILDFWSTFPYYMEFLTNSNGLMSLRLLRLFRVLQLLRLGSYNTTFTTLLTVLNKAVLHLKILLLILSFGAALFGSLVYWLERGTWQYWEPTGQYEFIRLDQTGQPQVSPFTSIPTTFYWFMVTATTVGYGDIYPTSQVGRCVTVCAMIMSILVVAFPVGVFSDLWSKEVEREQALRQLEGGGSFSDGTAAIAGDDDCDSNEYAVATSFYDAHYQEYNEAHDNNNNNRTAESGSGGGGSGADPPPGILAQVKTIDSGSCGKHYYDLYRSSSGGTAVTETLPLRRPQPPQPQHLLQTADNEQSQLLGSNYRDNDNNNIIIHDNKYDIEIDNIIPTALDPYSSHLNNPLMEPVTRQLNYGYQHAPHVMSSPAVHANNVVLMQKTDLADILLHIQTIENSQQHIRGILHKYKIAKSSLQL